MAETRTGSENVNSLGRATDAIGQMPELRAEGLILGSQDATPLEFWVGVETGNQLELDDLVVVETVSPRGQSVCFFGIIDAVRKRYEGAQYDTDAFRAAAGTLPVDISYAAHVQVTRVDPEVFIPPHPGDAVRVVRGEEFQRALYFDQMEHRLPIGLTRTGEPVFANLEFLDGTRGAHASISGVSGVATKTSYATFLLYSLFHSQALGSEGINSKALIFNVKGEDLLWLDRPNVRLNPEARALYERLGLPAGAFQSVGLYAPTRRGQGAPMPDTGGRQEGVRPYLWTIREFAHDRLLRFAFVEAEANRGQLSFVIVRVERALEHAAANGPPDDPAIEIDGQRLETFDQLVDQLDGPTLGLGSPSEFFHAPWGQIPDSRCARLRAASAARRFDVMRVVRLQPDCSGRRRAPSDWSCFPPSKRASLRNTSLI